MQAKSGTCKSTAPVHATRVGVLNVSSWLISFSRCSPPRVFVRSRTDTALEIIALRQQVAVLKRKRLRPTIHSLDRFFWTTLCRFWNRWPDVLVIVKPDTVNALGL